MHGIRANDKVFVAGHRGLVGQALVRSLNQHGYENILTCSRDAVDLEDAVAVKKFFTDNAPDIVIVAAAKVGGIKANDQYRFEFIQNNLAIQSNIITAAHESDTDKLVFLGSSCIYPKMAPQPMPEDCLLTGPLEMTNRPYAIAKIAGLEMVDALRRQYQRQYFSVMPTNLYGRGDNFHPENSHVLPALLRRFQEASESNAEEVVVWGSGKPRREFLYSDDCADAIVFLLENLTDEKIEDLIPGAGQFSHVNIGSGEEVSISTLAETMAEITKFSGTISFDASKPDGTPRKLLDCSVLRTLGWKPKTTLHQGIQKTLDWFLSTRDQARL